MKIIIKIHTKQITNINLFSSIEQTLGKVGCVKTVYSDGDMRVLVANQEWTFNPLCCTLVPHRVEDMNNTLGSGTERTDPMRKLMSFYM